MSKLSHAPSNSRGITHSFTEEKTQKRKQKALSLFSQTTILNCWRLRWYKIQETDSVKEWECERIREESNIWRSRRELRGRLYSPANTLWYMDPQLLPLPLTCTPMYLSASPLLPVLFLFSRCLSLCVCLISLCVLWCCCSLEFDYLFGI